MWPRVGSKETMWIDKAFPEKDALGFLTRWGTAWFPNHVRAVLSKIGESPEKSWFGNVWYLGSPWTMTYYDWLVVSNMAGLFYHGLFEGNHPQMDPWCWYINANMTGVYWWDPWHTIYNSTMDPSWVMGCHPKKTIDELHHSEKDGFFKHQPDDHQLCINGLASTADPLGWFRLPWRSELVLTRATT